MRMRWVTAFPVLAVWAGVALGQSAPPSTTPGALTDPLPLGRDPYSQAPLPRSAIFPAAGTAPFSGAAPATPSPVAPLVGAPMRPPAVPTTDPVPEPIGTPPPPALGTAPANLFGGVCSLPAQDAPEEPSSSRKHAWVNAEYLLFWVHEKLPPLATTFVPPNIIGQPTPTAPGVGILGQSGTEVLFGGNGTQTDHSGARLTAGFWEEDSPIGFEARFGFLGTEVNRFSAGSDASGNPTLSRPVINALTGQETVLFVSNPNEFTGSVVASTSTSLLDGALNALVQTGYPQAAMIVGFRYLNLRENLSIGQDSTVLPGATVGTEGTFLGSGTNVLILDGVTTRNQFLGGQIGAQARCESPDGWLWLKLLATLGVGVNHESIDGVGSTTITPAGGAPTVLPGGLLVQETNGGHLGRDRISVVPEVGVTLGCHLSPYVVATVGYTFLYWSEVVRPEGIDRNINPTQLPTSVMSGAGVTGPAAPGFPRSTDFWAQGLNVGLGFEF